MSANQKKSPCPVPLALPHTGLHAHSHSKMYWASEKEWLPEACFFKTPFSELRNCLLLGTSTLYLH